MTEQQIRSMVREFAEPARIQREWDAFCRESAPMWCWGRELFAPPSPAEQARANHNALLRADVRRVARLS